MTLLKDDVRKRLQQARKVTFFTGAGMSQESGVPTFRDFFNGLWVQHDPMELATPQGFKADPQRVWDFYVNRGENIRQCQPNEGHRAIAALADLIDVHVVTQNIDNLHQDAGCRDVLELHGNIFHLKPFQDEETIFAYGGHPRICHACSGYTNSEDLDEYVSSEDVAAIKLEAGEVPKCPACGNLLRPDVVWFGEPLDPVILGEAVAAVEACDVLVCIGASLEVQPAASLPFITLEAGAIVIEINPQPVLQGIAHASISGKVSEILPKLIKEVGWS